MKDEEYYKWYDCNEFPNYQINKMGQMRYKASGRILKGSLQFQGYLVYTLRKDGKSLYRMAHVLVAKQFIPNPENKRIVNHIDENKRNCCVDNLEWVSNYENSHHGTSQDRRVKKLVKPVNEFGLGGRYIRTWKSTNAIVEYLLGEKIPSKESGLYTAINTFVKYNSKKDVKKACGNSVFMYYDGLCNDVLFTVEENQPKPRKYGDVYKLLSDNIVVPEEYLFDPFEIADKCHKTIELMLMERDVDIDRREALNYALKCIDAMNVIKSAVKTI